MDLGLERAVEDCDEILDLFPIVVVQDRYTGVYSGGRWLAIASASAPAHEIFRSVSRIDYILGSGPHGNDLEASEFWSRGRPDWIAVGGTPDEAVDALRRARLHRVGEAG